MNGSLYTADRATHRRILLTAFAGALLVVVIALGARGPISNRLQVISPAPGSLVCGTEPQSLECHPVRA